MKRLDPTDPDPRTARVANHQGSLSIRHLLGARAARHPDATALVAPGRAPLTYRRLVEQVDGIGDALRAAGVESQARVALVLPQSPEAAVAGIAVAAATACAPLNPAYRAPEYDAYLTQFNVRAVIVQSGLESPVRAVAAQRGLAVLELTPCEEAEAGVFSLHGPGLPDAPDGRPPGPDDIALVLATSGTTSRPKTVPLTHANLCTSALNMGTSLELREDDRCLNVMPLFHIHGLMVTFASLVAGGSVLCTEATDIGRFFGLLDEFSPTWYSAVPTIHMSILSRSHDYLEVVQRRPLRFVRSSSSALPPRTAEQLEALFAAPVIEAFGMTEAAHQIATNPRPPGARRFGSVGIAAGPEVAVMDEAGNLRPPGEPGELVLRGPSIMRGYEADPAVNAAAFTDGWFRTGDEGVIDPEGYISITGRLKEIINRGGQKIAPREVDEVLMDHPAVAQAVTFAVPHSTLGEDVAAAIVLRQNSTVSEGELREFAGARLAAYKVPRRVLLVSEIPRGATGKLQRIGLADRLGVGAADQRPPGQGPSGDWFEQELIRIWEDVLGVRPIGIRDDFFELGGHSLLAAEMMARVEQMCRVRTPLSALLGGATVSHLARALRAETAPTKDATRFTQIQEGTKPSLFFLHGDYGGGGTYCLRLARILGNDQPFYLLHPHGLDGEPPPRSLEAMAADHLDTLRKIRPSGPLILGGHSNGALIALEMARRLHEAGQPVDLLILVAPPRRGTRGGHPSLLRRLRARLRHLSPSRSRQRGNQAEGAPTSTPSTLQERWVYLDAQYRRAMENYAPRRYAGRTVMIWGQEELARSRVDLIAVWRRLLPQATVHTTPGDHLSMLTTHGKALGECLRRSLSEPLR